ncbi:MAG: hypothetical protein ABIH76_06240 [Candidatus Bathyarchaeota archaeon]
MSALKKLALVKAVLGGYDMPEDKDEQAFYTEVIERCIKGNVDPSLGMIAPMCIIHNMWKEEKWKPILEKMNKKLEKN